MKEEHSVFNILKRVIANCTYCSVNRSQLLYNAILCTLFILFFFGETASAVVQIKYDSTIGFEQNEGWTDMMYKDDDGEIISVVSGDFYMRRAQILTDATYVHSGSQGLRIIGKYYTSGPPHEPKGELQIQNLNYPSCFGVWIKHVHGNPHNIEINIDLNDGQGFQFVTNFYVDLNTNSDWVYFETSLPQAVDKSGVTIQLRNTGGNGCYYAFDDMVVVSHTLSLVTNDTSVTFDVKTGDIYSFIDRDTGSEFMSPAYREPLFRITLTSSPGGLSTELNSREFTTVTPCKTGYSTFKIDFKDHTALPTVSVLVTGEAPDDGMIRMRISVNNNSSQCVANVAFPQLPFSAALGGDRSDDYLLMPWSGGGLLRAPGRFTLTKDAAYPGLAFAQFYALYDDTAGAYVAMNDSSGHCKQYHLNSAQNNYVMIELQHRFSEVSGQDASLTYDVLLHTFHGKWRTAADIYKTWAVQQSWCSKTLTERDDVSQILKDGSALIILQWGNPNWSEDVMGANLEKIPGLMDDLRDRAGVDHMICVTYGWENRGVFAGINYFPTLPSDQAWRQCNAELKRRGHLSGFLTSGTWWVVKRQKMGYNQAFDDTADFENRKDMCIYNADETIWNVDRYENPTGSQAWRGYSVKLCKGSPVALNTMKQIFLNVAHLGVSLISYDQEIGGEQTAPCYHAGHNHPPGWGNWMWTHFRDLNATIINEGKSIEADLGLFLENESELAIPYMSTYWSRQFGEINVGTGEARGVGLFSYLYHEYVTAIGAACVQYQGASGTTPSADMRCYILSNNLLRGLIQGPFYGHIQLNPNNEWQAQVSEAYFSYCQPYSTFSEFLILGKTLHPIPVECDMFDTWLWTSAETKRWLTLPTVSTSRFEAPNGLIADFVVNATSDTQQATVALPPGDTVIVYKTDRTPESTISANDKERHVELTLEPFGVRILAQKQKTASKAKYFHLYNEALIKKRFLIVSN